MTANVTSLRLQILQNIDAVFSAMTVAGSDAQYDAPPSDPYGFKFSTVEIGPLAPYDQRKQFSMGIVAGAESETFQFPFVMCFLKLNLELRVTVNRDDVAPGVLIEQLITSVKRAVGLNRSWGGIAIDTKVDGTEVDLVTYADRSAMGVLMLTVQYRYGYSDPRSNQAAY